MWEYTEERPHDALAQVPPATYWAQISCGIVCQCLGESLKRTVKRLRQYSPKDFVFLPRSMILARAARSLAV